MSVESSLVAIAIPMWFIALAVCVMAVKSLFDPCMRLIEKHQQQSYGRVPMDADI